MQFFIEKKKSISKFLVPFPHGCYSGVFLCPPDKTMLRIDGMKRKSTGITENKCMSFVPFQDFVLTEGRTSFFLVKETGAVPKVRFVLCVCMNNRR